MQLPQLALHYMPATSAGMFAGMRAKGEKADLALVVCETDAVVAGVFTTNVMAAAPVTYCREVLSRTTTARAVRHAPISRVHLPSLCNNPCLCPHVCINHKLRPTTDRPCVTSARSKAVSV